MPVTKPAVPFLDLPAQQVRIRDDLRRRLDAVLAHCQFILGPEVAELEQELARFCEAKHCVSVSSGTDALQIAMMAENIGPIVFVVVVVGGLGSVGGALAASLLIGCVQTFAVGTTLSLGSIAGFAGAVLPPAWASLSVAQIAPVLPYVLLVAMLALRPRGLFGQRGDDDV